MFNHLIGSIPKNKCKWVICHVCDGDGHVDHPAFSNGFGQEEWHEMQEDVMDDGESAATLYLKGFYDVPCKECNGSGKLMVPNMELLSFSEKRPFAEVRRDARINAEINRESYYERLMGA